MAAKNFEVVGQNIHAPVTALSFLNSATVIAGEGSNLKIFSTETAHLLGNKKIFQDARVHNIKAVAELENESSTLYAVVGGKSVRLVEILKNGADICFVTEEKRFRSWIWDVVLLEAESGALDIGRHCLALISSQNQVFVWNWKENRVQKISCCAEQCILYSAAFWGSSASCLTVAVGTVFNEVLLWKPYETRCDVSVEKRLKGHEGVIFSVVFQNDGQQLLSVSDDRSIRLWNLNDCCCLRIFYGHTARVWSAEFFGDHLVSIGEDAACILWNIDGTIIKKFKGHKGKSIWSLAVDADAKNIATGGGDGGIRLWSASQILANQSYSTQELLLPSGVTSNQASCDEDFPRTVRLLNANEILVLTNNGCFLHYRTSNNDDKSGNWNVIFHDENYSSYCCVDVDRKTRLAVFGSLKGSIKIVKIDSSVFKEIKAFDGKTLSIFILNDNSKTCTSNQIAKYLIASGPDGKIIIWSVIMNDGDIAVTEKGRFQLPYCRQRWAAAVAMIDASAFDAGNSAKGFGFIVGDRRGSVHVFHGIENDSDDGFKVPTQSLLSVHGKTGVTCVVLIDGYVYTSGRDGFYRIFKMNDGLMLQSMDRKKVCKGMDWIEGLKITQGDILVYGFYMQSYFAVWSSRRNELLIKILCGGGYRAWDLYMPSLEEHRSSFIYLKGPVVKSCIVAPIRNQRIIKEGLHGREVNCIEILGQIKIKGEMKLLFATGSEDTLVQFVTYSSERKEFECIHSIDSHIGSVKSICFLMEKDSAFDIERTNCKRSRIEEIQFNQSYLLFTCGSRTSLKCTRVYFQADDHVNSSLLAEIGTPINSLKNKSKMADLSDVDDLRFLSLAVFPAVSKVKNSTGKIPSDLYCIAAACSDANIRFYGFSTKTRKIKLLTSTAYHARCVQVVRHFSILIGSRIHHFVLSGGTDGRIALWDLTKTIEEFETSNAVYEDVEDDKAKTRKTLSEIKLDRVEDADILEHEIEDCQPQSEGSCSEGASQHHEELGLKQKTVAVNGSNYYLSSILHASAALDQIRLEPLYVFDAHQSGIHSIDVIEIAEDSSFCLASGGDDNALFLSKFKIQQTDEEVIFDVLWSDKNIFAHHSTITGVRFAAGDILITSSVDQRIKIWRPALHEGSSSSWQVAFTCFTDISDVSDLACWTDGENTHALVSGVGIELKDIRCK